jgi:hypothetical protein
MLEHIETTDIDEIYDGEIVDGIRFDVEQLFTYLIVKFVLSNKALRGQRVESVLTIEGVRLDDRTFHVTSGSKLVDPDYIDLNTEKVYLNMQSDFWCFPIMTIVAKDKKSTYQKYFAYIFEFCNRVREFGLEVDEGKWTNIHIPEPQDMKSHQICLKRGGAANGPVVAHFDHLCMCISDNIDVPKQVPCCKCDEKGRLCYCYNVVDKEEVEKAHQELAQFEESQVGTHMIALCDKITPVSVCDKNK